MVKEITSPVEDVRDKQLLKDMLQAEEACRLRLEALKRRKESPNAYAKADGVNGTDELLRAVVPEAYWRGEKTRKSPRGTIPPTKHIFLGLPEKHSVYIGQGYVPVVHNGQHVRDLGGGMLAYWKPQELYDEEQRAYGQESHERLASSLKVGAEAEDSQIAANTEEHTEVKQGAPNG